MIRYWLRGDSTELPWWGKVILAAKEWRIPPWEIAEHATLDWWNRWDCWREEVRTFQENRRQKANDNA